MIISSETLWIEIRAKLRRFIAKHIADENTLDDVLQEVSLKILSHAHTLQSSSHLESWSYQITRNAIVDYYRSQKHEVEISEALPTIEDNHEDDLAAQLAPCLRAMIGGLPAKYREALTLTEYEGLTQHQMAHHLGISLSGAKSRVQRAKEHLKGMLLQCCHFELDRRGKVIDYYPRRACCADNQSSCKC